MAGSRRPWGWHRLHNQVARQLVDDAGIAPGATVLDVGAGTGAITAPLVAARARVVAVEAHRGRAQALRERFGDTIVVVRADARDLRLPRRPYHVVANPPFAVTTALLRRIIQPGSRLVSARLILQEQAARRWAGPGAPGVGRWGHVFHASLGRRVPRRAFRPPPPVDTRVLVIERR